MTDRFIPSFLQKSKKWDFTSGDADYYGVHKNHKASEDDPTWLIWKMTYDVDSNKLTEQGPLKGSWSGRAALDW